MGRIFGKNGIRGLAVTEITCELAMQIGRAAAKIMAAPNGRTKILIGRDIRHSADTIEAAVCAGICSAGADAELLGEIPASALAWHIRKREAQGGIMITASHVGAEFNGIKLFSSYGYRLRDDREEEIERLILDAPDEIKPVQLKRYGSIICCESAVEEYIEHILEIAPADLSGLKIAIDCANGCASHTAERLFTKLGADVTMLGNTPDGFNINTSGSTRIDALMEYVAENKLDCGIAFDGSGERCLAVDENGCLVDGDVIIAACSGYMQKQGTLRNNSILVTQANNMGLIRFARESGIGTAAAPTGERGMMRRMLECGFSIGGDPSGHIIFPDDMPAADGQLTGIRLLEAMKAAEKKMSELAEIIEKCPQVMLNVPIENKYREVWKNNRTITSMIDEFESILGDEGRVIVRETGAEPVIRIRIEGRDFSAINTMALSLADTIKEQLSEE
ncbi:MAG: phosphoglucosamine mutase [Ruminococcus sp.]|nr:phosphoglucosamine mutase [Ruminococcus sp.]